MRLCRVALCSVVMNVVAVLALGSAALAAGAAITDVPAGHWAYASIQRAMDAGLLQGYDGKFHGGRLLNRYHAAIIVARLLEAAKAPGTVATTAAALPPAALRRLQQEFRPELALLATRASALERETAALRKDAAGLGSLVRALPGEGGVRLSAFASLGLVKTDDLADPAEALTRYRESPDSLFFTLPQVSLGVDCEFGPDSAFHAQFDYFSDVNDATDGTGAAVGLPGTVGIDEAYFQLNHGLFDIDTRIGAFALPFLFELTGPFRTSDYTITPSMFTNFAGQLRLYGLGFSGPEGKRHGRFWYFGVGSGAEDPYHGGYNWLSDLPPRSSTTGESDGEVAYYAILGERPCRTRRFGWHIGIFDNGGMTLAGDPLPHKPDSRFMIFGAEYRTRGVNFLAQMFDGDYVVSRTADGIGWGNRGWYFLLNHPFDSRDDVTLRYDIAIYSDTTADNRPIDWRAHAYTLAWNHRLDRNSLLQLEYLAPDFNHPGVPGYDDPDDDVLQVRYKVSF